MICLWESKQAKKAPQGWEVPMCPTYYAGKTDDLMACIVLLQALVSGAPLCTSKIIAFSFNALGPQFFYIDIANPPNLYYSIFILSNLRALH